MKLTMKQIGMTVMVISYFLIQGSSDENLTLKTDQDRANYATGVKIVRKLKQQGGEVNLDIVIQGMKDALTDDRLLLSDEDAPRNASTPQNEPVQPGESPATARSDSRPGSSAAIRTSSSAGPGEAEALSRQASPGEGSEPNTRLAPDGTLLSRRNQAKLDVGQLKAEMRTRVLSGGTPDNQ